MAVCVGKVVPLLPSLTTSGMELSVAKVEGACQNSANCRKTQQKFLHPLSKDTRICKSRKGRGGNTASQHCFVIAQSVLDADDLAAIHEGMFHGFASCIYMGQKTTIESWCFGALSSAMHA